MAVYATDAFTDTATTLLSAHTPSTGGGAWVLHPTTTNTAQISDANRVRSTTAAATSIYTMSGLTIASADYEVQGVFRCQTLVTGSGALLMRWDATAATGYALFYTVSTTAWTLNRANAGTFTQLGSSIVASLSAATDYSVTLRCSGSDITAITPHGTIGPITDGSPVSTTGRPGIRWASAASNTTGLHFDDLLVQDIPVATGGGHLNRLLMGVG